MQIPPGPALTLTKVEARNYDKSQTNTSSPRLSLSEQIKECLKFHSL